MPSRHAALVALALLSLSPAFAAPARADSWFWPQQAHAVYAAYPDTPAGFLAVLNAERRAAGLGPVGWDSGLAARAAANPGVHDGTPGQCWSGVRSYREAAYGWLRCSAAHRAILMGARSAVGVSPSRTGMTAGTR